MKKSKATFRKTVDQSARDAFIAGYKAAMRGVKKGWVIVDPKGNFVPDVLSHVGDGDAWISFYHRALMNTQQPALRRFRSEHEANGYKAVEVRLLDKEA